MASSEIIDAIRDVRKDDIIIAFMGPTGVGKSYFIDLLTGQTGKRAGNTLKSVTTGIQATRVRHPKYGTRVVLVDTPGFDDTTRTDMEILTMISDWLTKTYKNRDVKLSGLVYLHRITDNRMAGTPYKNLRMFGGLCGDNATSRVILVSTMWERVDPVLGATREAQLQQEFWRGLIEKGSGVDRLQRSHKDEAWRIIGKMVERLDEREKVLLQEEIVDLGRQLNETEAGRTLYTDLQKLLAEQKATFQSLVAQVEKSDNPILKKELQKEYKKIQAQFEATFKQVDKLKISLGRRIRMFFFTKKARAKAIKIAEEEQDSADTCSPHADHDKTSTNPFPRPRAIKFATSEPDEVKQTHIPSPLPNIVRRVRVSFLVVSVAKNAYGKLKGGEYKNSASVRNLLFDVVRTSVKDVAGVAANLSPSDAQLLVDYLDTVLREEGDLTQGDQNRILRLLSKVVASQDVIPKYYQLQPIPLQAKSKKSGTSGAVFRGSQDNSVCVKVMKSEHRSEEFIRELIFWAHTSHDNILPLHGAFFKQDPTRLALVSTWMDNGNLEEYVKATKDDQDARLSLLSDVICGLSHIHKLDIVHSDLKGENVLISHEKRALIADFGASHISTATASSKTSSAIAFTWNFAAPEMLDSLNQGRRPKKACDIWSFGVLTLVEGAFAQDAVRKGGMVTTSYIRVVWKFSNEAHYRT
ncbi:L-type lectin-domain containing receptor kinase IV.3 [Leucoagaricus sp. SymC.cos]|nr:L-type lectin-domain containing receptor kinase IV.3 [Leucoagaricus sp. SymC.cos]